MMTCSGSFTVRCCLASEVSDCTRLPAVAVAGTLFIIISLRGRTPVDGSERKRRRRCIKLRLASMSSNSTYRRCRYSRRASCLLSRLWARSYDDRRRIVERTDRRKSQFGASCVCYKLLRFEAALTATNINIVGCPHHPRQLNSQLLLVRGIALFFSSCQRSVRHTYIHARIHRGRWSLPFDAASTTLLLP